MLELPLVALVFSLGTPDGELFSNEVTQRYAILKERILPLPCDQSMVDIRKNVLEIQNQKPDVIVLCPNMELETLSTYSALITEIRPCIRDASGREKFLIYNYENENFKNPAWQLRHEIDEYFCSLEDLLEALVNHNRI